MNKKGYVLLEKIGQGGYSKVFLAKDSKTNKKVAIKVITKEYSKNEFQ